MPGGSITDAQAHQWLQQVAQGDPIITAGQITGYTGSWISLHYDNPGLGGDDSGEISGGGYLRFQMVWSAPSNRAIWSLVDARFTGLVQNKLTYFGVWDSQYKGLLRAYAELPEPVAVLSGKGYILHAGSVVVSFG